MHRTTRRILFYIALVIFLGVSYVAVLYAQGYRYSFSESRFIRTGALEVKVNTPAHLFVNDQDRATTSFLTNIGGVNGLLPGTYSLSVRKEGYSIWQKRVTIKEGFVEDFPRVMILPQVGEDAENVKKEITNLLYSPSPSPSPTLSPTRSPSPTKTPKATATPTASKKPTPSPSPTATPLPSGPFFIDKSVLYVQGSEGPQPIAHDISEAHVSDDHEKLFWTTNGQIWVYWLNSTGYQPFHEAGDIAMITSFKSPILAAAWFQDSDHIVIDVGTLEHPNYKIMEIDTRGGLNIINY